jgi:RNA polymerase sigma-70 factor (ECF subfamily)
MDDEMDALYRRFAFTVHRRCLSMLGDPDEAQDVTHDVFVKVLELGDVDIHTPSAYFYVIATRLCLNRLRARRTRKTAPQSDILDQIVGWGDSPEELSGFRLLLQKLLGPNTEETQIIAVLHHLDGMTLEETAEQVQTSVSTVRRRLRALRIDLKQLEGS